MQQEVHYRIIIISDVPGSSYIIRLYCLRAAGAYSYNDMVSDNVARRSSDQGSIPSWGMYDSDMTEKLLKVI